ncbi:MAG: hypothetical protein M0P07_04795 [Candidatus Methanomethylophilaceae archaeon]|nr:hypothetical protein [Candidatus Methanomethylophilaceae archaeon]
MDEQRASAIFLNVVESINNEYFQLRNCMKRMDTRVFNLKNFEIALSSAMTKTLWETEKYKKQIEEYPLPLDPQQPVPYETFRSWVVVYELIMRDYGLIGTKKKQRIMGLARYESKGED